MFEWHLLSLLDTYLHQMKKIRSFPLLLVDLSQIAKSDFTTDKTKPFPSQLSPIRHVPYTVSIDCQSKRKIVSYSYWDHYGCSGQWSRSPTALWTVPVGFISLQFAFSESSFKEDWPLACSTLQLYEHAELIFWRWKRTKNVLAPPHR